MWYGTRWSDLLKKKLISSPCMAAKQSPEMPSIWVNVYIAMHCTIATWESFWLDIASFWQLVLLAHISISQSKHQRIHWWPVLTRTWPPGLRETLVKPLKTWTVEGRDVKLSDSPSCSLDHNLRIWWIWWQVVWLTIRKPSEFVLKM